jgi:hypothetical protein
MRRSTTKAMRDDLAVEYLRRRGAAGGDGEGEEVTLQASRGFRRRVVVEKQTAKLLDTVAPTPTCG